MVLVKYINGNTTVTILEDGTKIREYECTPVTEHPESIDVKITNYCNMGCSYCHESSTVKGVHGDLDALLKQLEVLPAGVELAIGGGNPLSHPNLREFLVELKQRGFIANLTVNQGHLKVHQEQLIDLLSNGLIMGLGISIINNNYTYIKPLLALSDNIVYHLIVGLNEPVVLERLAEIGYCKVLLLGYKQYGFGKNFYNPTIQPNIDNWKKTLPKLIGKYTISFDNLGIEQLNVRRLFTVEGWEKFYMGDDFKFTMYIDAVKQEYAQTSRSKERHSFSQFESINHYFKQN